MEQERHFFKRSLSLLMSLIMIFSVFTGLNITVSAASTADGFEYEIQNNEIIITRYTGTASEIIIPDIIESCPVTSIGGFAFSECYSFTSVEISNNVTSIGEYAFNNCYNLTSVEISNNATSIGEHAFSCCESLTSITIPDNVTSIGKNAFSGCESLTSITIPDSVTSIEEGTFSTCYSLNTIMLGSAVERIGEGAFNFCESLTSFVVDEKNPHYSSLDGVLFNKDKTELIKYPTGKNITSYEIPEDVTNVCDYAFEYCKSLTSIIIPGSVTNIGCRAFGSCEFLTSIIIPDSVRSVGAFAFSDCESLASVTIGDGVTAIGEAAFSDCESLTAVIIGDSVTSIGEAAFEYCNSLISITIPDSVTSMGGYAFYSCDSLTSITIGKYVESIGKYTFSNCSSLTSITIPNSVSNIGDGAFSSCYSLTSVTIPDSVTSIGSDVFADCDSLTTIKIPDSVTSIGDGAFGDCDSLVSITIGKNNPAYSSIDGVLFNKNTTELIKYPAAKAEAFYEIPDGVTNINKYAFGYCDNLKSVVIPKSVMYVESYAFYSCLVFDIYYSGTKAEWNNVYIVSAGNENFFDATIHYNYDGNHTHTVITDKAVAPTCTTEGKTEGSHCSICGQVLIAQEQIPATGHKYDNGTVTKQPTCTAQGVKTFKCTTCAYSYTQAIAVKAHTYKNGECTVCGKWQYKNTAVKLGTVKNTTSGVQVTWSKLPGADKYVVYRKTTGGWTKLTTNATGTSYTDKTAKNNVKYTYTVRAINGTEYNTTYNKTGLKITFMSAPKITSVTNAATGVTVKWGKVSGATTYYVYRKTTGGWTKLGTSKTNTFTDKTAKNNTKYTYTVRASKSGAASAYYAGKAITFMAAPKITKIANVANGVTVTWGKVSGATVYTVYRKTTGGWTKLGTSKTNTFTDKTAKNNVKYTYTVRASKSGAASSYYAGKAIVRLTVPKLTKLTATAKKNTLTYGKVTGATSYIIYRKTGNGGWVKIATTKSTKYVDTKIKKGTYYTYTVRAVRGTSTSYYNTKGLKVRAK